MGGLGVIVVDHEWVWDRMEADRAGSWWWPVVRPLVLALLWVGWSNRVKSLWDEAKRRWLRKGA